MDDRIFTFKDDEWVVPELRDFFAFPATRKLISEIVARHQLSEAAAEKVFLIVRDVVKGRVGADEVTEALTERAGLEFETALDIHGDLSAELFPEVEALLEEQAGIYKDMHPEDFLPPPPPEIDATEDVAREITAKSGLAPKDPVLLRRLESIVISRLKDIRDETEVRSMLEKPTKTGGMGFTPEQAAALSLLMSESLGKVAEVKDDTLKKKEAREVLVRQAAEAKERRAKELSARLKIVAPTAPEEPPPPPPESTKADLGLDTANDAKEVKKLEEDLPKKIVAEEVVEAASAMDTAVNDAITETGVTLTDDDMRRRFRTLVTLYFRDLRDKLETKSKFSMPVASGGMGMDDAEAERVIGLLERRVTDFRTVSVGRAAEGKAKFVSEQATKHMQGIETVEKKEQEALDKQYRGLLEKTGVPVPAETPRLVSPSLPKIVPVTSGMQKPSSLAETPASAPSAPPAPASATATPEPAPVPVVAPPQVATSAPTPPANLPVAPPPVVAPAPVAAPAPAIKPVVVPSPVAAVAQPSGETRPTVADVKFVPKLTGPIEELRQLMMKDFRKLSKEPREATLKIKDKIDLLEDQGFEQKTLGIKAWQESEVNKLYLDTLRQSLEGKPVIEVIAERELAGQPSLNKAEFDAIMELNRKLRFG